MSKNINFKQTYNLIFISAYLAIHIIIKSLKNNQKRRVFTMQPTYSHSNYYFNQNYTYFNQEPELINPPPLQKGNSLDRYFANDFAKQPQYNFAPHGQYYETENESLMQATRLSTEATVSSESTPSYLKSPYPHHNYSAFHGQNNSFMAQSESQIPLQRNTVTSMKMSYNQVPVENVTNNQFNQYKNLNSNQEDNSKIEATDDVQEEEEEESDEEGEMTQAKSLLASKVWDEGMDEKLIKLGDQFKGDWKKIAKKFNNKKITPHFIKMRFKELNSTASITRRIKFNHREDLMIAKYFDKYGSNWSQMAVYFPDRTAIMLKNRYYSFIRKRDVLELLLNKAREIEANGGSVDNLKTPESDRYTECMDLKRESCELVKKVNPQKEEKYIVSSYQGIKLFTAKQDTEVEKNVNQDKDKEVKILKARVKSLQALYLQARNELEKYKKQQN